jgi:ribosomal protein S18 acetylase RimI-like enzyme
MTPESKKLDNPVWYSLSEVHQAFALDYNNIKFYRPEYCPFGALVKNENIAGFITEYSLLAENFFIVGEKPKFSNEVKLKNELVCIQMMLHEKIKMNITENIIELNHEHSHDLFQLVNLVQPGYFKNKTFLLGNYYGIFTNNQLVSVTGERMQMNQNIEVSAVVTHPGHMGKGYATQLIAYTANAIFDRNKNPFLHAAETNIRAIKLYERLGFKTRRKISFWNFVRNNDSYDKSNSLV